jgi:hypothetical protein
MKITLSYPSLMAVIQIFTAFRERYMWNFVVSYLLMVGMDLLKRVGENRQFLKSVKGDVNDVEDVEDDVDKYHQEPEGSLEEGVAVQSKSGGQQSQTMSDKDHNERESSTVQDHFTDTPKQACKGPAYDKSE